MALMTEMPMEFQCPPPEVDEGAPEDEEMPGHPPEVPSHDPPAGGPPTHDSSFMENGLDAQTLWDASMAQAITTVLEEVPGALVLHMVGSFHVENYTGIPEKVEHYRPGTRSLVMVMELAEDFGTFDSGEHAGLGDFVILTDKSLDLHVERNCGPEGS
jgi:hypothetical protein